MRWDMGGEKKRSVLVLHPTSLASIESLSLPLVQEIVISADMKCSECRKRISEIMSRVNVTESVVVNSSEKKVVVTCRRRHTHFDIVPLNKKALLRRVFRWTN